MKKEIWRPVPGFVGLYEVSDRGRLRRLRYSNQHVDKKFPTPKLLKFGVNKHGYVRVSLSKNDKQRWTSVHRLVLLAFVGNPSPGEEACHLDGSRSNNFLTNLIWGSRKLNCAHKVLHGTNNVGDRNGMSALRRRQRQQQECSL